MKRLTKKQRLEHLENKEDVNYAKIVIALDKIKALAEHLNLEFKWDARLAEYVCKVKPKKE